MYQSKQGNLGMGKAIGYFVSKGYPVSLPLNDTQKYDLIVDIQDKLYRVSVKTSRNTTNGVSYSVQLRNTGGNRTGKVRQVPFDNSSCDLLFIYTADERMYLIPSEKIQATNSICVGNKYLEFLVTNDTFLDQINGSNPCASAMNIL
jgi:hypothetical protein